VAAAWRAQRRRSSARVMRVVATDRTIVAARIAAMAHGGRYAGTAAGGGSGGTGAKEGVGGAGVAHAAGARTMAAVRQTASPPGQASVLRMRRSCAGAGWWFIEVAPSAAWADVSRWPGVLSALTPQRMAAGIALDRLDHGLEQRWVWWCNGPKPLVRATRADNRVRGDGC
jgi:hypothetical protein